MKRLEIPTLDSGYCEYDDLLLHACFAVLVRFIERDVGVKNESDWEKKFWLPQGKQDNWDFAMREHRELYEWWREVKNSPDDISEEVASLMLGRLINVHRYMWT